MIALYQNGERLRPSNGYPMRLLLPGYEGNMNIKWLRRLKVTAGPTMTREETSKYTMLLPSGKAWQFFYPMDVKSVITHPSPDLAMQGAGLYQISGLAWSGKGKISKVEVSADGGRSWAPAALQEPVLPIAFTRFRIPGILNRLAANLLPKEATSHSTTSTAFPVGPSASRGH